MAPTAQALNFLLNTLIDLYVMVIALRFLIQAVRANYHNPLAQFIVKVSTPPLMPLRRIIPGLLGQDMAAIVLCIALLFGKLVLFKSLGLAAVVNGYNIALSATSVAGMLYLSMVDLLFLYFNIFFFALIIQALISWVNPSSYNPLSDLLYSITAPLLHPVQRFVPPIGGIDLSPLVAILLLQMTKIILSPYLMGLLNILN